LGITLEPIEAPAVYLLRSGPFHIKHGDPYTLAAVVEVVGDVAEIKGATGRLMEIPAIRAEMKRLGVRQVRWQRSVAGEMILHTMEV
jgi:hypothetical protein